MLVRLLKMFMVLALAGSIGLHWVILQTLAWTGMVIRYSQDAPLIQAVTKTFDGKHPCSLCKQIATGKRSEKKSDYSFDCSKLEFRYVPVAFVFRAPTSFWEVVPLNAEGDLLAYAPALPPPRSLFV